MQLFEPNYLQQIPCGHFFHTGSHTRYCKWPWQILDIQQEEEHNHLSVHQHLENHPRKNCLVLLFQSSETPVYCYQVSFSLQSKSDPLFCLEEMRTLLQFPEKDDLAVQNSCNDSKEIETDFYLFTVQFSQLHIIPILLTLCLCISPANFIQNKDITLIVYQDKRRQTCLCFCPNKGRFPSSSQTGNQCFTLVQK